MNKRDQFTRPLKKRNSSSSFSSSFHPWHYANLKIREEVRALYTQTRIENAWNENLHLNTKHKKYKFHAK